MSKNKKNNTRAGTKGKNDKKMSLSAMIIAAVSAVLVLAFIVSLIVVIAINSSNARIDYMKDNLSKYIYISKDDYKGYTIVIEPDEITDKDVDREILALLYSAREKESVYGSGYVKNVPITAGDIAYIYYRGYTVDENGVETELPRSCNFFDTEPMALSIGSLSFIPGFEEGLVGVVPAEYAQLEIRKSGKVLPDDVIYLSYVLYLPNGETKTVSNERIDLTQPDVDEKYGRGFSKHFVGKMIGTSLSSVTFDSDEGTLVYSQMNVSAATSNEGSDNLLTIDAHFPADYEVKELRGLDVKFDVYVRGTNVYKTPEYNDAFVTDTLKIDAQTLAGYEGQTLAEKYRALLKERLTEENEEVKKSLIEEKMWEYLEEKAQIKKLPKGEVNEAYNGYYSEVEYMYSVSSGFSSLDSFAAYYLDLDSNTSWLNYIKERAENAVTLKLIFYYIIDVENLAPKGEVYDEIYERIVGEALEYYIEDSEHKTALDACETEEARAQKLAQIRAQMIREYGEDYFVEIVYYEYGIEKLVGFANIEQR